MRNSKAVLIAACAAIALAFALVHAGPYPNQLPDHGHTRSGDGGVLTNLTLTQTGKLVIGTSTMNRTGFFVGTSSLTSSGLATAGGTITASGFTTSLSTFTNIFLSTSNAGNAFDVTQPVLTLINNDTGTHSRTQVFMIGGSTNMREISTLYTDRTNTFISGMSGSASIPVYAICADNGQQDIRGSVGNSKCGIYISTDGATYVRGVTDQRVGLSQSYTVGEYVSSTTVANPNFPSTGNWGDLLSISLTAGDWDITATFDAFANGATVTDALIGLSQTSGNSTTGLNAGDNRFATAGPTSNNHVSLYVPNYRLATSASTTVYLKYSADFSVATPKIQGARISARRTH